MKAVILEQFGGPETLKAVELPDPKPGRGEVLLRVLVLGEGSNAGSEVEARLEFSEHQSGTRIHWTAEIKKLAGMLKIAPATQVQTAAQQVINEVWTLLTLRISK